MKKLISHNRRFFNLIWMLLIVFGLSGIAFGATFTVTTTADTNDGVCDADCSLREAINAANAVSSDDIVNFDASFFTAPQVIIFSRSSGLTIGDFNASNHTGGLTINGTGANRLTINGNNAARVFGIFNAAAVISGVTITGGKTLSNGGELSAGLGGGILNFGSLALLDSIVSGNSAGFGGGIASYGSATLTNVTISNNTSNGDGGGITTVTYPLTLINTIVSGNRAAGGAGAIYCDANCNFTNSSIVNNTATSGNGGGLSLYSGGGFSTFTNSFVSGNAAAGNGGGIYADGGQGGINFNSSTLSQNRSTGGTGGGIYATASRFDGAYNFVNSTISGNTAAGANGTEGGGGAMNLGTMSFTNSTVSDNAALNSLYGGGIANKGVVTLVNSTLSTNTAGSGGGIVNYDNGTVNLTNTTIAKNIATAIGGGLVKTFSSVVRARNTIIADNSANTDADFSGGIISQGYNLIESNSGLTGTVSTDRTGQDPQLLPLGFYGGTTRTHALRATSPAIDAGLLTGAVTTDQRGRARPYDFPGIPNAAGGDGSDIGSFERQAAEVSLGKLFDFDGDGRADLSVFRPSSGSWYILGSQSSSFYGVQFGSSNDKIAPADYDGDGRADLAVFRENITGTGSTGAFYILNSADNSYRPVAFGSTGDIPISGDWDGDGIGDPAVYRDGSLTGGASLFIYRPSSAPGVDFRVINWGAAGDKPVVGDYDGDGKLDAAIFRPSIAQWYILRSSNNQFFNVQFGQAGDVLAPADYSGDGITDVGVFRPSNGTWYYSASQTTPSTIFTAIQFGQAGDLPVPADYDGDGKADVAVFRPSNGIWYLNRTTQGFTGIQFGASGDKPAPNAYVR